MCSGLPPAMWRRKWWMACTPNWWRASTCPCCCAPSTTAMKHGMFWSRVPCPAEPSASCRWLSPHRRIRHEKRMIKTTTTISNKLGLHARASAKLTKLAGSFPCEVWIAKGERRVNAKSIMGVMMLAAGMGSEVVIDTDGDRAQEAMDAILALIADKFGEGE